MSELPSIANKILSTGITEAEFIGHHVKVTLVPEAMEDLIYYQAMSRKPQVQESVSEYFRSNNIQIHLSDEDFF